MKDQFDEKTEDAFNKIFAVVECEAIKKSAQEVIKTGSSFVKIENGSIVNLDKSEIFNLGE